MKINGSPDQLPTEVACPCEPPGGPPLLLDVCNEKYPLSNGSRVCSPGTSGGLPTPGPNVVYNPGSVRVGNACP